MTILTVAAIIVGGLISVAAEFTPQLAWFHNLTAGAKAAIITGINVLVAVLLSLALCGGLFTLPVETGDVCTTSTLQTVVNVIWIFFFAEAGSVVTHSRVKRDPFARLED